MKIKIVLVLLVLLISLQSILAIGVTPGRTTINFEPGASKVEFSVLNSESKDMVVVFTVRGDLAEYVSLSQTSAEFSSNEGSKSFSYSVNLPERIDDPGVHEAEIVVLEVPSDFEEEGTSFGASVSVITQLHVYVPYPDKYIEAKLKVVGSGEGWKSLFFVPITNRGEKDISNVKTSLEIYNGAGEKIETLESSPSVLKSLENTEFILEWTAPFAGTYRAVAKINYDGEVLEKEIDFNVGEMALEVVEIQIEGFVLGGVAKFDALVENRWSSDLENVYLNIIIYNDNGGVFADFKSQTYDLSSLSDERMVAYWDTTDVERGLYDGKLVLKYGEKSIEKNIQLQIDSNQIKVFGITGKVISTESGLFNLNNILIILVIVLIVANVFWFIVVKRLMKKK
jgi:hypothetical protein